MFATNSQLKEKIAGLESSLEQSAADLAAAQNELSEALKAKEELFAKMQEINERAEKAEAEAKAAQELLSEAEAKVEKANEAEASVAATINRQVTATMASIGAEAIPATANTEVEPDVVAKWKSLSGQARIDYFKANSTAIKSAMGLR